MISVLLLLSLLNTDDLLLDNCQRLDPSVYIVDGLFIRDTHLELGMSLCSLFPCQVDANTSIIDETRLSLDKFI